MSIISTIKAAPLRATACGLGALLVASMAAGHWPAARAADLDQRLPPPTLTEAAPTAPTETVVFAGGCFWGVQGVFQHVKGVKEAMAGYDGGKAATAQYETVSTGTTGHAESVRVTFDPKIVSYGDLLQVFFSVVSDPTQLNQQYPDTGTQYRSEIFTTTPEQARVAKAYIAQLDQAKAFPAPIATVVGTDTGFYKAEGYHQNYLTLHPDSGYISTFDLPKVEALSKVFPERFSAAPVLVSTNGNT
jgi:peptide-methionine (S)-S-oxide reductase